METEKTRVRERESGESRQPYSLKKPIEAVKGAVTIEQVAAEYGAFRLVGAGRLVGRCIALDHEDKTPSLMIYTDSQRFRCYGCGLRGDVIDLEEIAGQHVENWTAVIALAERYGVELPRRPERWHKWTNEKYRRHQAIRDVLTRSYQRRFFRLFGDYLEHIGDPEEREAEARLFFEELYPLAKSAATQRMAR